MTTARKALEKMVSEAEQGKPFDLFLLEKRLPDIDAADLARKIYTEKIAGIPCQYRYYSLWKTGGRQ